MSVPEAAKSLGLAPATVRAQIRHGKIAAQKSRPGPRGDWFIQDAEVERYRRENKR